MNNSKFKVVVPSGGSKRTLSKWTVQEAFSGLVMFYFVK